MTEEFIVHLKRAIAVEVIRFPKGTPVYQGSNDNYIMKSTGFRGEIHSDSPDLVMHVKKVLRKWSDDSFDWTEPFVTPCIITFMRDNVDALVLLPQED